jgi:hypothetical protein
MCLVAELYGRRREGHSDHDVRLGGIVVYGDGEVVHPARARNYLVRCI